MRRAGRLGRVRAVLKRTEHGLQTCKPAARLRRLIETTLTPRERIVLEMRYGLGGSGPYAQREVATVLGISRSYVSRIEKHAVEKMARAYMQS